MRQRRRKAGEGIRTEPQPKKAKQVFDTTQKATVIVQGHTARLTRPQIISALREALDQAGEIRKTEACTIAMSNVRHCLVLFSAPQEDTRPVATR